MISNGAKGTDRAWRICSLVQRVDGVLGCAGSVMVFSPVGLHEDAIDVLQCDGSSLLADGLNEGAQAQVAGASQQTLT